jgi:hypothetical protein
MASLADPPVTAHDVARGVSRWLWRAGITALTEVPLANGRRADVLGLGSDGRLTLVEIKVSLADLRGDLKWPEYLDYCDRYFWAVPVGFPLVDFDLAWFQPARAGLLTGDRWDAAELRPAAWQTMAAPRRKVETLRFARRAAQRLLGLNDPGAIDLAGGG